MSADIVTHLYQKFYEENISSGTHASVHWKNFSNHFQVKLDSDGTIEEIKGYGFGGSEDKRFTAKMIAWIGNALNLSTLHYSGLSEYLQEAKATVAAMGLYFSQDAFRQACTCFFLSKKMKEQKAIPENILVIGDGHGILSALLSEQFPNAKLFLIDLGKTLFFQAYYLGKTFPGKHHTLFGFSNNTGAGSGFFYCVAEGLNEFPPVRIDLAINIASMQEMTMQTIETYFTLLRNRLTKYFYCCNRLEKKLPDGEIIRFMQYPWKENDKHMVDEKCPWHQFFLGRASSPYVKLMNIIPVPMLHRYDGIHWHRFTLLSQ